MTSRPAIARNFRTRIASYLSVFGFLGCVATVLGFFGGVHNVVALLAHFRVQYFAGLLVIALLLAVLRSWRWAGVCLVFSLINASVIAPLYFGNEPILPSAPTMRAMLFNVNSQLGDPNQVRAVIEAQDPDILVLEEISDDWVMALEPVLQRYPHSVVRPRSDNFGIGLYSRIPLENVQTHYLGGSEVPTLTATLETPSGGLDIIATHPLPPMSNDYAAAHRAQMGELAGLVQPGRSTLLIGDLNATPWDASFRRLLRDSGLRDSMRGFGVQPSWPSQIWFLRIPIDHVLHSEHISIVDREVLADAGSDHFPIVVDFVWWPQ
ncbi:endonuclease/exonuclease/phosphatase family protein [Cerasicoccus fimbriatus]|uniref:endonuclease/exonuclease/phosphatase family protein n=1 Tax=Cerasicoccus fimbriatus TaxID=3014554 RepID=UPI0022B41B70|nr:endonuclease/exonuclease/phosphatase family protein [Cerasicoccus sp. TK19100]